MRREHRFRKVTLANRRAAGDHHQVGTAEQFTRLSFERGQVVEPALAGGHYRALAFDQRSQRIAGAVGDGVGRALRRSGLGQFVAGREQRHPRLPVDGNLGPVSRRNGDQRFRVAACALLEDDIAFREIAPLLADVAGRTEPGGEAHALALTRGIFLHDHAIGALGQRRPGEYPHGRPGGQRVFIGVTGPRLTDHPHRRVGDDALQPYRIAIHGGNRSAR